MWNTEDPRYTIGKRADIVIHTGDDALKGQVETKHSWSIWTTHEFDRYSFIGPDDDWPSHWQWVYAPPPKEGG